MEDMLLGDGEGRRMAGYGQCGSVSGVGLCIVSTACRQVVKTRRGIRQGLDLSGRDEVRRLGSFARGCYHVLCDHLDTSKNGLNIS